MFNKLDYENVYDYRKNLNVRDDSDSINGEDCSNPNRTSISNVFDYVYELISEGKLDKKITIKGKETIRKEVDTKNTSYNAARRLFPNIDFRKSERCKSFDDNKVDATLIAEYARRKNL
jgi:hypothetical protein